jgi:hypothetical protein
MKNLSHRRELWERLVVCFLFLEVQANSLYDKESNGENDKVFYSYFKIMNFKAQGEVT